MPGQETVVERIYHGSFGIKGREHFVHVFLFNFLSNEAFFSCFNGPTDRFYPSPPSPAAAAAASRSADVVSRGL